MIKEEVEVTLQATYKNLAIIRNILRTFLDIEKVSKLDVVQIVSAVDELSTNVIEHAYQPDLEESEKSIKLIFGKTKTEELYISVEDFGNGIVPNKKSKDEGGMGLNIVRGVVRDLNIINKEIGTKVEIIKNVKKEEE